jgi:hypothetical protein
MPQAVVFAALGLVAALILDRLGDAVEDTGQAVDSAGSGALKLAAAVAVGWYVAKKM